MALGSPGRFAKLLRTAHLSLHGSPLQYKRRDLGLIEPQSTLPWKQTNAKDVRDTVPYQRKERRLPIHPQTHLYKESFLDRLRAVRFWYRGSFRYLSDAKNVR